MDDCTGKEMAKYFYSQITVLLIRVFRRAVRLRSMLTVSRKAATPFVMCQPSRACGTTRLPLDGISLILVYE